ncbi:caspase domain-containing protein [Schizophyllum fasciatum]
MMWNLGDAGHTDAEGHHHSRRHTHSNPNPTFPTYDSYPMPSPSYGLFPPDPFAGARAMPTPDTLMVPTEHRGRRHSSSHIHIHQHHSSHSHRRHSHSRTRYQTQGTSVQTIAPGVVVISHPPPRPIPPNYTNSSYGGHRPPQGGQVVSIPQPSIHPQFRYSRCCGRKKALCIGINYKGTRHELYGCINDANAVRNFLIKYEGYKAQDIVTLTDDNPHSRSRPTRQNMLEAMRWLVKDAQPDDSLFFHCGQTKDKDGDEVDGWDEVIYPLDYETAGHIVDDRMHAIMVKPLPAGCRLTYSSSGRLKGSHVSNRARKRKATPADVISWSGCEDRQTSADTFSGGVAVGAMSHVSEHYIFVGRGAHHDTRLSSALSVFPLFCHSYKRYSRILHPKYSQKPQLGSSHPIDTNLRFII